MKMTSNGREVGLIKKMDIVSEAFHLPEFHAEIHAPCAKCKRTDGWRVLFFWRVLHKSRCPVDRFWNMMRHGQVKGISVRGNGFARVRHGDVKLEDVYEVTAVCDLRADTTPVEVSLREAFKEALGREPKDPEPEADDDA